MVRFSGSSITIDLLEKTDERISAIYATRSGAEAEIFNSLMRENNGNGRWLAPQEVVEMGLADKIIAPAKISNSAQEIISALKLPEIPNQQKNMTIKQHWNAILELLGVAQNREIDNQPPTDCGETDLENEITHYQTPKENEAIAALQNKIFELEATNAKLRARATQTFPKEDPSLKDVRLESNAEAYQRDISNFK